LRAIRNAAAILPTMLCPKSCSQREGQMTHAISAST
jgi:hypothetical protein